MALAISYRHLLPRAQVIVQPQLDDVDTLVRLYTDGGIRFRRSGHSGSDSFQTPVAAFEDEALSSRLYPCHTRPASALLLAKLEDQIPVGTHTQNRRHTVRYVGREILLDVFASLEFGILFEINRVPDVSAQVDDPRHHECAPEVHGLRSGRSFGLRGRPHPSDAAIVDFHGGGHRGRHPRPVDQYEAL